MNFKHGKILFRYIDFRYKTIVTLMLRLLLKYMNKGACELDDLIFKNGQEALHQELESFVQEFEASISTLFVTCDKI